MDLRELFDKYKPFVRQNLLILASGLAGLTLFIYGLISLFLGSSPSQQDIVFEAKDSNSENISNFSKDQNVKSSNLTIDIAGSVVSPGVYHLPLNSRIQDALVAAGGLSSSADRNFISKNINLATKLSDGAKIYLPRIGESELGLTSITGNRQININSATEQELDSLPGIGPATIQKIVSGRPYSSISDLLDRKIVGGKVFSEIQDKISLY